MLLDSGYMARGAQRTWRGLDNMYHMMTKSVSLLSPTLNVLFLRKGH